jgi:uncharacterized membrane protein YgcG
MNTRILLLAFSVAALSSCTSMYKSGQTPDDVYYSPARPAPAGDEYVRVQEREERYQTYDEYTDSYRNDRFLRMGIRNRYRLNAFDDMDWYNMRYDNMYNYNYMGFNGLGLNNPWNSYYAWNSYYNPYCSNRGNYYYGNNWKSVVAYRPAPIRAYTFNSNSYKSSNSPLRNSRNTYYNNGSRYNNNNSGLGNSINRIFNNSSSHSNNNNSAPATNTNTPTRSYSPSSSGSSGSSGGGSSNSGGSGSGVKRPGGGK